VYAKYNLMAELGKLSQGRKTTAPAWLIAKLTINEIRALERAVRQDDELADLEGLFRLEDPRD